MDFCSSNVMDEQCFDLLRRSTPALLGIFPPDDVQGILWTGRRTGGMIFIEIRNKLNDIFLVEMGMEKVNKILSGMLVIFASTGVDISTTY